MEQFFGLTITFLETVDNSENRMLLKYELFTL